MNRIFTGIVTYQEKQYLYIKHTSLASEKIEIYDYESTAINFEDSSDVKKSVPLYSKYIVFKASQMDIQESIQDISGKSVELQIESLLALDLPLESEELSPEGTVEIFSNGRVTLTKLHDRVIGLTATTNEVDTYINSYETSYRPIKTKGISYKNVGTLFTDKDTILSNLRTLDEVRLFKDLTWLKDKNYWVVRTKEAFDEVIDTLKRLPKGHIVAIDTETTGLKFNNLKAPSANRAELVGIVLSWEDNQGVYIPVAHRYFENIDLAYCLSELRPLIDRRFPSTCLTLACHNLKFDWKVFWAYGIDMKVSHDSLLLKYMIDNRVTKIRVGLKALVELHYGIDMIELSDFFKVKKMAIDFSYLTLDRAEAYAPADADFTRKLTIDLLAELPATMAYLYGIEVLLARALGHTEFYGVNLGLTAMMKAEIEAIKKAQGIKREVYLLLKEYLPKEEYHLISDCFTEQGELIPEAVNEHKLISSPKQLEHLLYGALQLPVPAYTASGGRATDKKALKALKKESPVVNKLLDFKKVDRQVAGFFKSIKDVMIGERVFTEFKQTGTESGRLSATKPNLQNQDNKVKVFFVPPRGYSMIDADYSQIEYRVMASLAQEHGMLRVLEDPDADFHTEVASALYGVPAHMVTDTMRSAAKSLNFGIPYGMGPESLGAGIHGEISDMATADGAEKQRLYFERYPHLALFFDRAKADVVENGFIETHFKRRRYLIDKNSFHSEINKAMRQAPNTMIQGTAADLFKQGNVRLMAIFERFGLTELVPETETETENALPYAWVVGNIHDELLSCFNNSKINGFFMYSLFKLALEFPQKGFCPLYMGAGIGPNWKSAKSGAEIPVKLGNAIVKQFKKYAMEQKALGNPRFQHCDYTAEEMVILPDEEEDIILPEYLAFEQGVPNIDEIHVFRVHRFQKYRVYKEIKKLFPNIHEGKTKISEIVEKYDDYKKRFWATKSFSTALDHPVLDFMEGIKMVAETYEFEVIDDSEKVKLAMQAEEDAKKHNIDDVITDLIDDDGEIDIDSFTAAVKDNRVLEIKETVAVKLGCMNFINYDNDEYIIDISELPDTTKVVPALAEYFKTMEKGSTYGLAVQSAVKKAVLPFKIDGINKNEINEMLTNIAFS